MSAPSELIAFVRIGKEHGEQIITAAEAEGPILWATGDFLSELEERTGGWDLGDHDIPTPPASGLWLFEGWIEVGIGEDPDIEWSGYWRRLTHWEMCQMRHGSPVRAESRETTDGET